MGDRHRPGARPAPRPDHRQRGRPPSCSPRSPASGSRHRRPPGPGGRRPGRRGHGRLRDLADRPLRRPRAAAPHPPVGRAARSRGSRLSSAACDQPPLDPEPRPAEPLELGQRARRGRACSRCSTSPQPGRLLEQRHDRLASRRRRRAPRPGRPGRRTARSPASGRSSSSEPTTSYPRLASSSIQVSDSSTAQARTSAGSASRGEPERRDSVRCASSSRTNCAVVLVGEHAVVDPLVDPPHQRRLGHAERRVGPVGLQLELDVVQAEHRGEPLPQQVAAARPASGP